RKGIHGNGDELLFCGRRGGKVARGNVAFPGLRFYVYLQICGNVSRLEKPESHGYFRAAPRLGARHANFAAA
ncbi:MAG: hypothetical protein KBO60_24975, partial [Achromobacter sp.]|nr:hypothetical protein [Achromobacter sp.]